MSTPTREENQPIQPRSLSSLIGSRICHDLISPIGAITNGLELLSLSEGAIGAELGLIEDSVQQAVARIKFFRIAFGVADDTPQPAAEISDILSGIEMGARISVSLQAQGSIARDRVQLLFLAVLCLERALPFGGQITMSRDGGKWQIAAQSQRLQATDAIWRHLTDGTAFTALTPATVQFALLREGAAELGSDLHVKVDASEILIRF